MGKGREKRRGRNIMVVSSWGSEGSEGRIAGRHCVWEGSTRKRVFPWFHWPRMGHVPWDIKD